MDDKKTNNMAYEKLAWQEEEKNLAEVEKSIDAAILNKKKRVEYIDKELSNSYIVDKYDREKNNILLSDRDYYQDKVKELERYKFNPYFGRIDLVREGSSEPETFFIGETGLPDEKNKNVISVWTEIGGAFHNKHETKYTIKGTKYQLALRRAIGILNAKLVSVNTEYDVDSISLDGDVIDEFLLSVLRDKRRNFKITDIIRSIQSNQNEIIRKPKDESFIVQGCAGSGKTMILFHRLSYIAFNYPDSDFSKCFILTPNKFFDTQFDELSKKLELDKIKRHTVEGFYSTFIKYLGRKDTYAKDNSGKRTALKVEPAPDSVTSEKLLNDSMLKELYSEDFYNHIITTYDKVWEKIIEQLDSIGLKAILKENGKQISDKMIYGFSAFSELNTAVSDIISAHDYAVSAIDKARANIKQLERDIELKKAEVDTAAIALEKAKIVLLDDLAESEQKYSELLQATANDTQTLKRIKAEREHKLSDFKRLEDSLNAINTVKDNLTDIGFLRASDSEIAHIILERCDNEIKRIEETEEQLDKIPSYNFVKRSRTRAELSSARDTFSQSAAEIAGEFVSDCSIKVEALRREIAGLDSKITEENLKASASGDRTIAKKLSSIRECIGLFELEEMPDIANKLSKIILKELPDSHKDYCFYYAKKSESEKSIRYAKRQRDENLETIDKNTAVLIKPEVMNALKKSHNLIEQLDFSALNENLESEIKKVYSKYGQKIKNGIKYRHGLFYKLLLCSLYYENVSDDSYFINIDEAQDLAKTEYMLMRRIFGPKTVFNLYGDVNQLVYSYKGITEWEEIEDDIAHSPYLLNENYRNTIQITEYCNNKFGSELTGIGLTGEEVKNLSFKDAIDELLRIKNENPGFRTAIIYRKGLNKITESLSDYSDAVVFNQIDTEKISVITVEEAKGLEFEAVVVIDTQMSMNEQYVSYTRALDNLIITELPGAIIDTEDTDMLSEEEAKTEPLTTKAVDVRITDADPYINEYFKTDSGSKALFRILLDYVTSVSPDIMIRVSSQFIGVAQPGEKCRFYITTEDDKPIIKFHHLDSKEEFLEERINLYTKTYQQLCRHIEKHPESIQLKKSKNK